VSVETGYGGVSPTRDAIESLRHSQALLRLVGQSPVFVRAIGCIPALARGDAPVVISGETGTGKELVARALHYAGPRAPYPFVPVNCGSLTDTLLEDELFGHERGAFTDARSARHGLLVHAERGTLFLDEVDSLTPRAQVALLRVLQDRTFRALGSTRERSVDVRFIAATNTPLRALVQAGAFRGDLFYRLCVLTVELPPLRARRDDVMKLARHFLARTAAGATAFHLSPAAERALLAHDWPGNVRELENVILRAQTLAAGSLITPDDLGLDAAPEPDAAPAAPDPRPLEARAFQEAKRAAVEAFELDYLTRLLRAHGGNVSRAARTAGTERSDLRRLLKKHRLDPLCFAAGPPPGVGDSSPTTWGSPAPAPPAAPPPA
jgi:DNA-binding NtrC family response regulator